MKTYNQALRERGRLIRHLLRYRDIVPGSLVCRQRHCGRANCICHTQGKLHPAWQLTLRSEGETKTIYIPGWLVEDVKRAVEQNRHFEQLVARIRKINLERLVKAKEQRKPYCFGAQS